MIYSYSYTDSLGADHEGSDDDLTALAKSLLEALETESTAVKIYDEAGSVRGTVTPDGWHLA